MVSANIALKVHTNFELNLFSGDTSDWHTVIWSYTSAY